MFQNTLVSVFRRDRNETKKFSIEMKHLCSETIGFHCAVPERDETLFQGGLKQHCFETVKFHCTRVFVPFAAPTGNDTASVSGRMKPHCFETALCYCFDTMKHFGVSIQCFETLKH